ncbi:EAL domain-containing protein [Alkalilimnicola ehrlichii]|nr:EAL domain-containing protein [Alkalilimnicola ehrlichii]
MIPFVTEANATALEASHNSTLVLLSYCIALLAAYTALAVSERVRCAHRKIGYGFWLALGAAILGIGVWSMHFIGMLAYQVGFPVDYAVPLTLASVLPAVVGSVYALHLIAQGHARHWQYIAAGSLLGLGIGIMHYSGMAAMQIQAELRYRPDWFAASLIVAIGMGIAAVYAHRLEVKLAAWRRLNLRYVLVAALIALAVSGMHYTAMAAVELYPLIEPLDTVDQTPSTWLAYGVSVGAMLVALASLLMTFVDRQLQHNQHLLDMSRQHLAEVVSAIGDGLILFDAQGRIIMCNPAAGRMLGRTEDTMVGKSMADIHLTAEGQPLAEKVRLSLQSTGYWEGEVHAKQKSGKLFPARLVVSAVTRGEREDRRYVAMLTDLSQQHTAQRKIRRLAYYDSLTRLPNRRLLQERLAVLLPKAASQRRLGALILFDIDNFKALNDTLGLKKGDELLAAVADRLRHLGLPEESLARLAGNEFAILAKHLPRTKNEALLQINQRVSSLRAALAAPYDLSGYEHRATFSVGVALADEADYDADTVLHQATLALSQAQNAGGDDWRYFRAEMESAVAERVRLEADLRTAIRASQLQLYYQPQVDSQGKIIGAEALARWNHPERGLISPAQFIPLAEETGLIVPLGLWVMEAACEQLSAWQDDRYFGALSVSVNVSVRQFQQPDFVDQVTAIVRRSGAPAEKLTLELTESLLMADVDDVIAKMHRLKQLGIDFSLDDFGTGYSSLSYLKRLPFDTLKIDVTFVRDVLVDANSAVIVKTILALAQSLQLKAVAEGVETEEQRAFLAPMGCQTYQGYLFGRPSPVEEFAEQALSMR